MKRNLLLTLAVTSLLVLSGCTSSDGYGEFTMVEDSAAAETTYKEAKDLNADVDDVEGYENVAQVTGSYTDDDETIDIDTKITTRIGIDNSKYASDIIIENSYGSYKMFERFNDTENKYYTYSSLNFTYTDSDTSSEVTFDSTMLAENDVLNADVSIVYNASEISKSISELHILTSMSYSSDMKIYTSTNGYYKVETTTDGATEGYIFDENGALVEIDATNEDTVASSKINYETTLENVDVDNYTEGDSTSNMTFGFSALMFMVISVGGLSSLFAE